MPGGGGRGRDIATSRAFAVNDGMSLLDRARAVADVPRRGALHVSKEEEKGGRDMFLRRRVICVRPRAARTVGSIVGPG